MHPFLNNMNLTRSETKWRRKSVYLYVPSVREEDILVKDICRQSGGSVKRRCMEVWNRLPQCSILWCYTHYPTQSTGFQTSQLYESLPVIQLQIFMYHYLRDDTISSTHTIHALHFKKKKNYTVMKPFPFFPVLFLLGWPLNIMKTLLIDQQG